MQTPESAGLPADAAPGAPAMMAVGPEFTILQASALHADWLGRLGEEAADPCGWTLDLSAVQEIDSAALQMLLALRRTLGERGQQLHLGAPSAVVQAALATYGLDADLAPLHAVTALCTPCEEAS